MKTKPHVCESCGMPMKTKEDFGGGIIGHTYCVHCTNPIGELRSYDEVLHSFTEFVIDTEGMTEEDARKMARDMMHKNPAWKDKAKEI